MRRRLRLRLPSTVRRAVAAAAVVSLVLPAAVHAAPGGLQRGYGADGVARPADATRMSLAAASHAQPDGTMIVAGAKTSLGLERENFSLNLRVHPAVYRYDAAGQRDRSFGTDGRASLYLQDHLSAATSVAVQEDGKILVSGISVGFLSARAFVARLHSDGSPDTGFGREGYVTTLPRHLNALVPVAVHPAPGGRVLVVATSFRGDLLTLEAGARRRRADLDVVLLRYLPDGTLDASYGSGGMVEFDRSGTDSLDAAVTAQAGADGSVTVGGVSIHDRLTRGTALLARFRSDGALDAGFGDGGVARQPSRARRWEVVTALEQRPDGGVVFGVARGDEEGPDARMLVRRLDGRGASRAWGDGRLGAAVPGNLVPTALLTLADGRTVIGGAGSRWGSDLEDSDSAAAAVARITAAGAPDASFDRRGVSYIGRDGDEWRWSAVADLHAGPDGALVASGTFEGLAGSVRMHGDAPSGTTTRPARVRVSLGSPLVRRCGFDREHACRVGHRRARLVRLDVETRGGMPDGHPVHLRVDPAGRWWGDTDHVTGRTSSGSASFSTRMMQVPGLYRVRVQVPATARTARVEGGTLFVRVVGPSTRRPPGFSFAAASARSLCAAARAGGGVAALNARAACTGGARLRERRLDARSQARVLLGR